MTRIEELDRLIAMEAPEAPRRSKFRVVVARWQRQICGGSSTVRYERLDCGHKLILRGTLYECARRRRCRVCDGMSQPGLRHLFRLNTHRTFCGTPSEARRDDQRPICTKCQRMAGQRKAIEEALAAREARERTR